jgi:hypothetical protein
METPSILLKASRFDFKVINVVIVIWIIIHIPITLDAETPILPFLSMVIAPAIGIVFRILKFNARVELNPGGIVDAHGQETSWAKVGKINCVNGSLHWEVGDKELGMTGGKFYFGNQFSIGGVPGIEISSGKIVDLMEQLAGEVSEQKRTMIILESHYSAREKSADYAKVSKGSAFLEIIKTLWWCFSSFSCVEKLFIIIFFFCLFVFIFSGLFELFG